jgi:dihydroorotase
MVLLIKGGHVVDPANKRDAVFDILIEKGKISRIEKNIKGEGYKIIEAKDKFVLPGLVDMHAHLRQPGREDEETLLTGSQAAIKGGFTTVCCMPNTAPAIDNQGVVEYIYAENKKIGLINIYSIAAITKNREGKELTEIGELKKAGAVALSDDGSPVMNAEIMRRALEYARMFDLTVISHCEEENLSAGGLMNEGYTATVLGLKGIPPEAESIMVARDIELARLTGAGLHIAHVSTKESVGLIRRAKSQDIKITCETCPHYFTLTEEAVLGYNTNCKVNPPLRAKEDVAAIKEGLKDGTIDAIATDHAPHADFEKDIEFEQASFGMIGLETALSLAIKELVQTKALTLTQLAEKMSLNPSRILGLNKGTLGAGVDADIVIIDLQKTWIPEKKKISSKSQNSPFLGWELPAEVTWVICQGRILSNNEGKNDKKI